VRRADNLTTFMCRLSINLGASTSWNPKGLSRRVMGLLYLAPAGVSAYIWKKVADKPGICKLYLLGCLINHELYQLHRSPDIIRRLRWAANLQRMGNNEIPKRITDSRLEGRTVGRLKLGVWM
jgi:hypothetical protein